MSNNPHDLFAALGLAPALPGARCRGKHHLFDAPPELDREDADTTAARHAQAIELCRGCIALASCNTWFDSLPPSKRPHGVIAGRINKPRPAGRPTTNREDTPA